VSISGSRSETLPTKNKPFVFFTLTSKGGGLKEFIEDKGGGVR